MTDRTHICPGCQKPLQPTTRQLKALAAGGKVYHDRECQKAANRETRPCDVCGKPVERRKADFGEKVACGTLCRGRLKSNKQEYPCEVCGKPVEKTPGTKKERVFCGRTCFGKSNRKPDRDKTECSRKECTVRFRPSGSQAAAIAKGNPVYCSQACRSADNRITSPCTGCGDPVTRYRSQMKGRSSSRVFCDGCLSKNVALRPRSGTTEPCAACGTPVYRQPSYKKKRRYCPKEECKRQAKTGERAPRTERPCVVCSRVMRLDPAQVKNDVRTCSPECTSVSRRRKPGERYIDGNGYAWITTPDGRSMPEHRYKMEVLLADVLDGGPLPKGVNVHHVNGEKADNTTDGPLTLQANGYWRSGNLELWTTHQPSGQRLYDLLIAKKDAELVELAEYRRRFGPLPAAGEQ